MDTMTSVRAAEGSVLPVLDNDELAHHAAVLVLEDVRSELSRPPGRLSSKRGFSGSCLRPNVQPLARPASAGAAIDGPAAALQVLVPSSAAPTSR
jgi:hypothetical protein